MLDAPTEQVYINNGNISTEKHVTLTIDTYMSGSCLLSVRLHEQNMSFNTVKDKWTLSIITFVNKDQFHCLIQNVLNEHIPTVYSL